jgi:hypothetical protein
VPAQRHVGFEVDRFMVQALTWVWSGNASLARIAHVDDLRVELVWERVFLVLKRWIQDMGSTANSLAGDSALRADSRFLGDTATTGMTNGR